jgi:recombination protein U
MHNPRAKGAEIMSKGPGKKFEEDFIKSVPDRCDITRLKDAGGWSDATNMRFTSSNPCDFVIWALHPSSSTVGFQYKLELKSTLGKSLPFGNIKDHQLEGLYKSSLKGVEALFIVNFRDINETYRVSVVALQAFINETDRKSIPIAWFRECAILIKQSLIRVRWRYDLSWL